MVNEIARLGEDIHAEAIARWNNEGGAPGPTEGATSDPFGTVAPHEFQWEVAHWIDTCPAGCAQPTPTEVGRRRVL
jgi:hypothetical protein